MKILKQKQKIPLFIGGFILFLLGIFGGSWQYFMGSSNHIENFISEEAFIYGEFDVSSQNILEIQKLGVDINTLDISKISDFSLPSLTLKDLEPWIGKKIGFVKKDSENFLVLAQFRNKNNTKVFLENFLAPDENFRIKKLEIGDLMLPEFSSQMAFMFYKGWVLMGSNEKTLLSLINSEKLLKNNKNFKKVSKDLMSNIFGKIFFNMNYIPNIENLPNALKPYKAFLSASKDLVKAGGVTIDLKNEDIKIDTKFLVHENIYKEKLVRKTQNQTIPRLSYLMPKDILFFVNGSDIYSKYKHTKEFLGKIDPQLELIFEGVFRAQSKRLFGKSFDLEKDFLSFLRGGYGFALDFDDGLDFAFISETSKTDDITIENLKKGIVRAQAYARPIEEEVELKNGKKRKELVVKNITDIELVEKKEGKDIYFEVGSGENKFAYSFSNPYFLFSTKSSFLEKILKTKQLKIENLAQNKDFRQSVLFDFKSSESYGFLNFSKYLQVQGYLDDFSSKEKLEFDLISYLKPYVRNIIFSRLVYPGEVFLKFIIKKNN